MMSLTIPDNSFVPIDRILASTRGVYRWMFYRVPNPKELRDENGKPTGILLHTMYAIRSDGRMYLATHTQTVLCEREPNFYFVFIRQYMKKWLDQFLDCVAVTQPVALDHLSSEWIPAKELEMK